MCIFGERCVQGDHGGLGQTLGSGPTIPALNREFVQNHHGHLVHSIESYTMKLTKCKLTSYDLRGEAKKALLNLAQDLRFKRGLR